MMVKNRAVEKRSRGRPQARCDEETMQVIIEAASSHFLKCGYAGFNLNSIAAEAGVSTKTIYRIFPGKSELLASVILSRIDRFFLAIDQVTLDSFNTRDGLIELLAAYGKLSLTTETIAITRLVLGESGRFPEIETAFYERAIIPTIRIIEDWLTRQALAGKIQPVNSRECAGVLRGMMVMEPQRAAMLGQAEPPSPPEIEARAIMCADLFLASCAA